MFTTEPKPKSGLEKAIDKLLLEMSELHADDDKYAQMVKQLTKLHKLKENEKPKRVDPNTLMTVFANVAAVLVVVNHERAHVITTKALQFVNRV